MTSSTEFKHELAPKIWFTFALALIFGGILATIIFVSTPYSYWLDELYSVTASNENFSSLYLILLGDVHPPLYQITLKLWISLFGDSEFSTRCLSMLFSIIAAAYLYLKTSKYGRFNGLVIILFFTTNWLVVYYGNEVRSYAMMLFFATLLASNLPAENEKPSLVFYTSSVLLSLTHYFGFLMAGVTLAVYFFTHLRRPQYIIPVICVGILCLVWPVNHVINGDILNKTNGNFWIEVDGFLDSFSIAANGFIPKTGMVGGVILIFGLLVSLITIRRKVNVTDTCDRSFLQKAYTTTLTSLILLILVAIIDVWSPMSTTRNYIVLVPFVSITLAATVLCLMQSYANAKNLLLSLLIVFCSLSLLASAYKIHTKSIGIQDWRGASMFIVNNHDGRNVYFVSHGETNKWKYLISNYYLKLLSNGTLHADQYVVGDTILNSPSMVLFGHLNDYEADMLKKNMDAVGAVQSYSRGLPIDQNRGQIGVYVID